MRPGCYLAPTLLDCSAVDSPLDSQELFGPLLPVIAYDDLEEVLQRIDAGPKPLALYLWSCDRAVQRRVVARTSSGSVGLNLCMQQYTQLHLPFGGVNHSGSGSAHGQAGFRTFSHERSVLAARSAAGRSSAAAALFAVQAAAGAMGVAPDRRRLDPVREVPASSALLCCNAWIGSPVGSLVYRTCTALPRPSGSGALSLRVALGRYSLRSFQLASPALGGVRKGPRKRPAGRTIRRE